ncbi:acetyltransferase (GNAT) family domain-containing protein [Purpureocillium lavendulum]|uniref:Acetyltransferase (GNAT) family domain-containing protein n=1 Tax=Purpureocillium lavendulum TaxID=1247861 RepID=A0AB34FML4_9HYPO|nr:acetyltransferase (GNAT) family domain-containing protein [Purpureocillium lavendulum]
MSGASPQNAAMTTTTTTATATATTTPPEQRRPAGGGGAALPPMAVPAGYHLRPGLASDVNAIAALYRASFGGDSLLDVMFPTRAAYPRDFHTHLYRHFQSRWWTPGWYLTVLVDDTLAVPVGFTWWRRPLDQLSFAERWLSPPPPIDQPDAWFAPLARLWVSLKNLVLPTRIPTDAIAVFTRVYGGIEPRLLSTPRRRAAWYLSTIATLPALQGRGLGAVLLRDGLRAVDDGGVDCFLIGVRGVEPFYQKFGFKEVDRANVGELAHWDGGAIMFRE